MRKIQEPQGKNITNFDLEEPKKTGQL